MSLTFDLSARTRPREGLRDATRIAAWTVQ